MKKIFFYANSAKPAALRAREALSDIALGAGLEPCEASCAEAVIALGGDGTILRAVRDVPGVPVIGFNHGGLGYLSSVEEKDFVSALEIFQVSRRRISSLRSNASRQGDTQSPREVFLKFFLRTTGAGR